MDKIIEYCSKNHYLTNFVMVAVILAGLLSWDILRKEEMPEFTSSWLSVSAAYPGASAKDVERLVVLEIEKQIKGISGIDKVVSTASAGSARISITLENNVDNKDLVVQSIREAALGAQLPDRVRETIRVFQWKSTEKAILDVALFYEDKDLLDFNQRKRLQQQAEALEKQLTGSNLIARVTRKFFLEEEILIQLDPSKIQSFELAIGTVANKIRSSHVQLPAGSLKNLSETKVSITAGLTSIEALKNIPIRSQFEGQSIYLKDVATIERTFRSDASLHKINGRQALILNLLKSTSADIIEARDLAYETIKDFQIAQEKTGLKILALDDESASVRNRIKIVSSNGIMGFVLILCCLFLFLEWRAGIWVSAGIPFCLAFTAFISLLLGYTVNNITLASIIIVLGIVVDDAIIVAESISRRKSEGVPPHIAVVEGTTRVVKPIIAAIITTCIAFLPFYFFQGHFSAFVKYIPVIVSLMLLASLIESFFILPSHLSESSTKTAKSKNHWFFAIEKRYANFLRNILKFRSLIVLLFIGLVVASGYLFKSNLKFVIFPQEESKEVFIRLKAEEDLNRFEMAKLTRTLENHILNDKQLVMGVRTNIGKSRRSGKRKENEASLRVELVDKENREESSSQIIKRWEKELEALKGFKEIKFIRHRWGFQSGSPIEILIQENNDQIRSEVANILKDKLTQNKSLADVEIEAPLVVDEYEINLNYQEIDRLNVDISVLTKSIRALVDSVSLFTIAEGETEVDVKLGIIASAQKEIDAVLKGVVANQTGRLLPINELVTINKLKRPANISRTDYRRTTSIYADFKPGSQKTPLEIAVDLEENVFKELGVTYPTTLLTFKGEVAESRSSTSFFLMASILILILIYGILLLLFKSLILPLVILTIVPFGVIGVIFAFYLHGKTQFGFFAAVGSIGMTGVVINDSIVLINSIRNSFDHTKDMFTTISTITSQRLRAVLVTTITTVVGLFPTAYGFAGFDSMLSEMMLAMGWGLVFGMFITLILTPILYSYYVSTLKIVKRFGVKT